MEPRKFDLEKALAGAKVVTRDGREVTQLHLFETNGKHPLMGVVDDSLCGFTKKGVFDRDTTQSTYDLFMAPVERSEWVVKSPSGKFIIEPFATLEQAKSWCREAGGYTYHEIKIIE